METPSPGYFLEPCGQTRLSEALADAYGRWRSECGECGQTYEGGRELVQSKMLDHVAIWHGDPSEARVELTEAGRAYLEERRL